MVPSNFASRRGSAAINDRAGRARLELGTLETEKAHRATYEALLRAARQRYVRLLACVSGARRDPPYRKDADARLIDRSRISFNIDEAGDYGIGVEAEDDVVRWWSRTAYFCEARNKLFEDYADGHFMTLYGDVSPRLIELLKAHAAGFKWFTFVKGLDASSVGRARAATQAAPPTTITDVTVGTGP